MTTKIKIECLGYESTGDCPCGCGEAALPYKVPGYQGYFDAAPACAASIAEDFLEDANPEEEEP